MTNFKALVIMQQDRLGHSLPVILRTLPNVGQVQVADELHEETFGRQAAGVDLVVADFDCVWHTLSRIVSAAHSLPQSVRILVIARNHKQQQIAANAGADAILLRGYSTSRLRCTVRHLLAPPEVPVGN